MNKNLLKGDRQRDIIFCCQYVVYGQAIKRKSMKCNPSIFLTLSLRKTAHATSVNYFRQGSYVFTCVCLSVCLSVCQLTGLLKTTDQIFMKFYGMVDYNPRTNLLDIRSRSKCQNRFGSNSVQNCHTESR